MSDEPPATLPQPLPGVPPPPPKLNSGQLWLSLLAPPLFAVLVMVVLAFLPGAWLKSGDWLGVAGLLITLGVLAGWVLFIICLRKRYRGASFVILILAYPLLQGSIGAAILFFGCLAIALGPWQGKQDPRSSQHLLDPPPAAEVFWTDDRPRAVHRERS